MKTPGNPDRQPRPTRPLGSGPTVPARRIWLRGAARRLQGGLALAVLAGVSTAGLTGCGFRPVYGTAGGDETDAVAAEMQATRIAIIDDRQGQILHNLLLDRFNPRGRPGDPRHSLSVELQVGEAALGTQIDATTTRARLTVTASATLRSGERSESFRSVAVASFATSESDYATSAARDSALERSLRVIADDLRIQIATYFEKQRILERLGRR